MNLMSNKFNPNNELEYVPFPRHLVEALDSLILYARKKGSKNFVQSETDWEVMDKIVAFWKVCYPEHWDFFQKEIAITRALQVNDTASVKGEGGAIIRSMMSVPDTLHYFIGVFFPMQEWDKQFVVKFLKKFPDFKIARKI